MREHQEKVPVGGLSIKYKSARMALLESPRLLVAPGTGVISTPLNLTLLILWSAAVASSQTAPTTKIRLLPLATVCDQLNVAEAEPLELELAASNRMVSSVAEDAV